MIMAVLTSLFLAISAPAKPSPACTPEKLGSFVGIRTVVANINKIGQLRPVRELPCVASKETLPDFKAGISYIPAAKLSRPVKVVGIEEKGKV
jgi:hypothetical protein